MQQSTNIPQQATVGNRSETPVSGQLGIGPPEANPGVSGAGDASQNEARLRLALAAGRMGTWEWDLITNAVTIDAAEAELLGFDRSQERILIEEFFQRVAPEDVDALHAAIQQAVDGRTAYDHEFRVQHPQRGWRWLTGRGEVEFDAAGHAVRMRGVNFDVTDRHQSQQHLAESEAFLRLLLDSSADCILVLDVDGRLLSMNRPGQRAFDIEDFAAVQGRLWTSFWPEEQRLLAEQALQTGRQGGVGRFQGRCETLRGNWKSWDVILTSLDQSGAGPRRLLCISRDMTELVDLSRARAESEERFRMLADNISQFAWMTDQHGAIVWYNQRWFDFTGTTWEEVRGWDWRIAVHPSYVERVIDTVRRHVAAGEDWEDTFPLRGKNGKYRWYLSRARAIRNASGQVVRWFGTDTDVTDQLTAEQALSQAHAQLKSVVDAAADAIFTVDDQGLILSANAAVKRMFGYEPAELANRQLADLIPPEQAAAPAEPSAREPRPGLGLVWPRSREAFGQRKDGSTFPIEVEFSPARVGRRRFFTGFVRDITARKRSDEMLRLRLRAIECATNGILITDALADDQPIVYANPAFEEVTGYRFEEIAGKNCRFLQGPDTPQSQVELIREAIKNRHECHVTILNYRKDGSRFWNDLHIAPVEDEQGRITNFVGIQSDITARIRYEQRLRESQEQANSANRAKSEFLANMSHEIRTPLTAILGCADTLFRQIEDADSKDVVRMIRDQGQLLLGILNDVLDLSKIEAGKLAIHIEPFDLVRIVGDVHSLMHSQAVEKGVELRTVYRSPIPEKIRTDPLRLRQILLNLVSNALKFTETGFVEIQLSCRQNQSGATLQIAVEDTGIGIPPHRLQSIFEAFSQEKSRLLSRVQGTGLGLTICQKLVQMLGGAILVTSQENAGSRFVVELPLGDIERSHLKNPEELSRSAALRDSQMVLEFFIPCRVLIAEDTRGIQFMMTRMLKDVVTSVTVAENGEQALQAIEQAQQEGKPFDIVLMDMQMPVMNGFDATRKLRARGNRIPVVALTAGAMAGDRERCLAAGCTDYLPKPIDRVELLALLGQYCET